MIFLIFDQEYDDVAKTWETAKSSLEVWPSNRKKDIATGGLVSIVILISSHLLIGQTAG